MAQKPTTDRRIDVTTDAVHELAHVERQLRADERVAGCELHITGDSARVYYDTSEFNESSRGTITAKICTVIAQSAGWDLMTVHDPLEIDDSHLVSSALTIAAGGDNS